MFLLLYQTPRYAPVIDNPFIQNYTNLNPLRIFFRSHRPCHIQVINAWVFTIYCSHFSIHLKLYSERSRIFYPLLFKNINILVSIDEIKYVENKGIMLFSIT